jgi:putative phosphoesterase
VQIGVISDIHGNLSALHAVWEIFSALNLTTGPILNAGDNVGYGDAPEACLQFLRGHPEILCVQGNYDRNVARYPDKQADFLRKWGKTRPEKYRAIARDSQAISAASREWLEALPHEHQVNIAGWELLLTHYAPGSKEGLGTWTPTARLAELAAGTDADVVICGHTHTPFARQAGGVLWLNPGTVGRGRYRRAAYAVLTLEENALPEAHLHQVRIS